MNRGFNSTIFRLALAILLGVVAITSAVNLFAAQYPSDIYMNRAPVSVFPGEVEHINWTITFTNTPISYSFSIYDPNHTLMFSTDFPAVGEPSPIISNLDWQVPEGVVSGPYLAEILFYTQQISRPFDSQAAITFIVAEPPTPTPTPTATPTPPPSCFGNIAAYVCEDKNANGVCREPKIDRPLPGVDVCLDPAPDGQSACQKTGDDGYARWQNLACGTYTVNEQLTGPVRGYYPSSVMSQQVQVGQDQSAEVNFSIVFPLLPRGIALNPANDKVYAAFEGIKELDGSRPYPFVAVIDSQTDRVIATIPTVGREPFGMAVANNKVYMAAWRDGVVTVIDSQTDQVIKKISGFVKPAQLAVDPTRNLIYVTDPGDGQVRVIDTANDTLSGQLAVSGSGASDPYDVTFGNGFAYATLRQASGSGAANPFYIKAVQSPDQIVSIPLAAGSPHAITARTDGSNTYLYITYAKDYRDAQPPYEWPPDPPTHPTNRPVNPNLLTVIEVPNGNPAAAHLLEANVPLGNFAENGLTFNPATNHVLGVYGGGFLEPAYSDALACALLPKGQGEAGSAYIVDVNATQILSKPGARLRVGNSTAPMTGDYWWLNPFDLTINPNNNKVYVIDRCWHDYDNLYDNLFPDHEIWHDGGGAVFVFDDNGSGPAPTTPTPTPTPTATPNPGSEGNSTIAGRVRLQGLTTSPGVTITINHPGQSGSGGQVSTPDAKGYFNIELTSNSDLSVTADAPRYLPAVCTIKITQSATNLGSITLLSGDLNDDQQIDIRDLTVMGSNFGNAGQDLIADINRDGKVDIYDLILVSKNFGKQTQVWPCSP